MGEHGVDLIDQLDPPFLGPVGETADAQVLIDGEWGEDLASLRHHHEAGPVHPE